MKLTILLILTVGFWLWLWFMVKRPEKWSALVQKENAFWESRGIAPASLTEWIKSFEKGRGLKVLVATTAVLFAMAVALQIVIKILR